ncbi:prephenate dehydratase [Calothrix sp. 336/3]|uniref:prephenate dehydratase n=1 Tax=Calothrix sp. 336/3 TaxID=1337936 RepID=UPI0004E3F6A3|nr:prephenate dehydratase [Calothrix sp. 336/3]AKG23113.1 prephenate dehydratase [Calothrix sp. 336/3]
MTLSIAHLGPPGTYSEQAAILYAELLASNSKQKTLLCPYPSIAQSLRAVAENQVNLAVVPVENSIEGGVTMTLDAMWQLDSLHIQLALIMPIVHTLVSCASSIQEIKTVYSHPQGLAQCQKWLEQFLPNVQLIPINSTTEALIGLREDITAASISPQRGAQLYDLPILAYGINDYPENCTRFWVVSQGNLAIAEGSSYRNIAQPIIDNSSRYTSLAFTVPANVPGALVKPLQVFAHLNINLSRIESRPTKRSLGEYLFFVDLEADENRLPMQSALRELQGYTEVLKIFGCYQVLEINPPAMVK